MSSRDRLGFLRSVFGVAKLSGDGINATVVCPACREKKSTGKLKLSIRVDDFRHHCWSCELKGGNLLSLLRRYFPKHVREYMRKYPPKQREGTPRCVQISLPGTPVDDEQPEEHGVRLPRGFVLLAQNTNSRDQNVRTALEYVRNRGLTDRDLWYFKFGVSWDSWIRNRVIMPSFDCEGKLNYWTARTWDRTVDEAWKYRNPRCQKSMIVFNEVNIDWTKMLTIVEGPFDLTKCNDNAVPLLGSTIRPGTLLFERIVENRTPVTLVLDAGEDRKVRSIAELLTRYGVEVWTANIRGRGMDPGKMSRDGFMEHLETRTRWDGLSRLTDLL